MAKINRNKVEQALYDIKKARQIIKKAAEDLESSINSRDKRILYLEKETQSEREWSEQIKEQSDKKLRDAIGSHVDEYLKGYHFEQFVVEWMHRHFNEYELKIWQGDKGVKVAEGHLLKATWNMYPDLIFVNETKKNVVALECKFRSNGQFKLTKSKCQIYKAFEKQIQKYMHVDVSVYIMVGNGVSAELPSHMYCIPIGFFDDKFEEKDSFTIQVDDLSQYEVMYWSKGEHAITKNYPF